MKNKGSRSVIEDIWMNTQATVDDMGPMDPSGPDAPASWEEVEEENIMLNPDVVSMESRG